MGTTLKDNKAKIRSRFEPVPAAIICDVFDEHGWDPPALAVSIEHRVGPKRLAGWAYTILGGHALARGPEPDRRKLKAVDDVEEDSVSVWAGTDARGVCLFGDLIAGTMAQRGCRGAIVDGGIRDTDEIGDMQFPVFARYTTPVQALGRWRVIDYNCPVFLPGAFKELVAVEPGDFVLGDSDGVVVISQDRVLDVLERSEAILSAEADARNQSADGLTAQQILEKFGHV